MAETQPFGDLDLPPPEMRAPPRAEDGDEFRGRPLGRILIKMGKLNRTQVGEALELQKKSGSPIGQILVRMGYVSEDDVQMALAAQRGPE